MLRTTVCLYAVFLFALPVVTAASGFGDPLSALSHASPDRLGDYSRALPEGCRVDGAPRNPLTLIDVLDRALCNNPQTREVWASAKAQAALVGEARTAYLPTLSATGQIERGDFAVVGAPGEASRQRQSNATATFNYLLFDFGGRSNALDSAQEALAAANWTQDNALQGILLAALSDYYQLFAAQAAVDAALESERSALESYNAAKARHEIGVATVADELQAKTAYAQAQLDRTQTEGNARIARGVLANVIGLDADATFDLVPLNVAEPDDKLERSVRELIEDAKKRRPDLAASEATVRAAEANIRAARAAHYPSLSLFANGSDNHSSVTPLANTSAVGLQLNIPLFSGFATTYRVINAEQQLEAQTAQRDTLRNQVALDVWRAYQNLATNRTAIEASDVLLKSATESEQVALGRYKAGVGSILDLLNAQSSLASARSQRIHSLYNWYIAKVTLAQSVGNLEPGLFTSAPPPP